MEHKTNPPSSRRHRLHTIIFEADTPAGKTFDIFLIVCILISVLVVMLDSIRSFRLQHLALVMAVDWFFTILFTIEYMLRLYSVGRPLTYARSFYGIVDLLAILPSYLSLFFPPTRYLQIVRILRVLRIFRVFKLVQYLREARLLVMALKASQRKITVFLFSVLTLVTIFGCLIFLIEGEANGFTSIPVSMYWAIVTLTTVGYGDLSPQTGIGQAFASIIMILGYAIIAVPTGIVSVELSKIDTKTLSTQACPECGAEDHDQNALYCKFCGAQLNEDETA